MPNTSPSPVTQGFPLDKADLCVKCGLCLPHCPTYLLTQNEAESPRGRIALMQGVATQQLAASPTLQAHLDHCLGCRNCESVCPAQVPYGELIDAGREALQAAHPTRNRGLRWLAPWFTQAGKRQFLQHLLRLYQALGLHALMRTLLPKNGKLARANALLPVITRSPVAGKYPNLAASRGTVHLFTGCVSDLVDGELLKDSLYLLQHCGFEVVISPHQGCCGALHQHNGMTAEAQRFFEKNLHAYAESANPIIGTATGCTAMLKEYGVYRPGKETNAMVERVTDICAFLSQHWDSALPVAPLPATALVHEPCSLRNVLGGAEKLYALLGKIPGLSAHALEDNATCCGAAGSMMLSAPEQADALVEAKREAVQRLQPDYLLTSNVGCGMHLGASLRRGGLSAEIVHPVSLLARQLRKAKRPD